MKVLVAGDVHANLGYVEELIRVAQRTGSSHILQVGDFGYWPRMRAGWEYLEGVSKALGEAGIDLYFCDGNHEDHELLDHDDSTPVEVAHNVWYGPRGSVVTFDGIQVLFMGGAVSVDRARRVAGYDWFSQEVPTEAQWERALEAQDVDIVLAHDVPEGVALHLTYDAGPGLQVESQAVRERMRKLLDAHQPKLWLGGHYHQRSTQQIGGTVVEILDCEFPIERSTLLLDLSAYGTTL